jgi:hypothetical protein
LLGAARAVPTKKVIWVGGASSAISDPTIP